MTSRCQNCQRWRPLFRGDPWGVRSFADAPPVEQNLILEQIKQGRDGVQFDNADIAEGDVPEPLRRFSRFVAPNHEAVSLPTNWPLWGECLMTDLEGPEYEKSMARACDGSDYAAVLRTHAAFGCVQWRIWDGKPSE